MINMLTLHTEIWAGVWDEGKCTGWLLPSKLWGADWGLCGSPLVTPNCASTPYGVDCTGIWICSSLVQGFGWACWHHLGQKPWVYKRLLWLLGFDPLLLPSCFEAIQSDCIPISWQLTAWPWRRHHFLNPLWGLYRFHSQIFKLFCVSLASCYVKDKCIDFHLFYT